MTTPKTKTTTAAARAKAAGAKAPADHKTAARAEADGDETITVTVTELELPGEDGDSTVTRELDEPITVTFERDTIDDYDIIEALGVGVYFIAAPKMFGEAEWGRIKEELRDERGRLRLTTVAAFVNAVFDGAKAGNS